MDKSKKLIIVIILLVVIIGGVSFYAFHQAKENKEMSELFAVEKLEMENEYTTFATQYDELQIQINNDSLREKLESEKLKTQRLLEELRQVKTSNAAEIMRLKKELKTVRAVLRTYVIQIDSLNKLNQALAEENQEVKDVKKIAISFTIVKNITAKTGERTLYIRIAKPDNDILTKNASNTFPYENRNLVYSIKKYIEYTGEEQNVTVYWDVEEYLPAGTYHVYIFADGTMIGQQAFSMK